MSFLSLLLLLTIFLTPLLGANKYFGYEQVKVFFFIASISLIAFLWMFLKPKLKWTFISLVSFIFISILFITSITGLNPTVSFLGNYPYFQGWIVYAYLFLFSLLVRESKIKIEVWAKVLVYTAVIVSLLAIKDWLLLNIFNTQVSIYAGRVVSTFGQPNFYSGFLLLSLPLSYFLFKKGNQWMVLLMIISMVGIFVSYSRLAIFLSLILFILAFFDLFIIKFRYFLVVFVLILMAFWGVINNEFFKPLNTNNPDLTKESVEKRAYVWPQIIKIAGDKPLIGYGLENINLAFNNYFEKYKHKIFEENLNIEPVLISMKDLNIDRTHNYILDLLVFSGVFGVGAWLFLVGLLIKKNKNKYLLISLLTYLIWIQFQNQSIVQLIYFWLLVGLIDSENNY